MYKIVFYSLFWPFTSFCQSNLNVKVSIWDDSTARKLNFKLFGVENNKIKYFLGNSNEDGILDLFLPTTLDSIIFKIDKYEAISFRVNFHGNFEKKSISYFSFDINLKQSNSISSNFLALTKPLLTKSIENYEIQHFVSSNLHCVEDISKSILLGQGIFVKIENISKSSTYKIILKDSSNLKIINTYSLKSGINFVDLNQYITVNDLKKDSINNISSNQFLKTIIYFDQSKYDLNNQNKYILNELAIFLKENIQKKIKISGFTDNVGDEKLNKKLAEYRAKTVQNYLLKQSLNKNQLILEWNGYKTHLIKPENLSMLRKVEIILLN
jgi:outer membrane protein OmpA-like peptidoglycan-associated protein